MQKCQRSNHSCHEMDVRPGGVWRLTMHGPDGVDYPNLMVFIEVARPERLVYDHGSGVEDAPTQFRQTVTFEQQGDKTTVTMRLLFKSAAERDQVIEQYWGAIEGGNQTLARLEQYLATM